MRAHAIAGLALTSALLLTACDSGDASGEEPVETATTSLAQDEATDDGTDQETLSVTFDGSSCSYDGPDQLNAGDVTLQGTNDSDLILRVSIDLLVDGATVDDFVEYLQPEPKEVAAPDFVETQAQVVVAPGTTDGFSYPLGGGEHVLVCVTYADEEAPPAAWAAQPAGVTVNE
jgi:hypothetical protein